MFGRAQKESIPYGTYAKVDAELHLGIKNSLQDMVAARGIGSSVIGTYIAYKMAIARAADALANATNLSAKEKAPYVQRLAQEEGVATAAYDKITLQLQQSRLAVTNLPEAVFQEVAVSLKVAERQEGDGVANEVSLSDQLLSGGTDNKKAERQQKQQQKLLEKELGTQAKQFITAQGKNANQLEINLDINSIQSSTAELNGTITPYLAQYAKVSVEQAAGTSTASTPTPEMMQQALLQQLKKQMEQPNLGAESDDSAMLS